MFLTIITLPHTSIKTVSSVIIIQQLPPKIDIEEQFPYSNHPWKPIYKGGCPNTIDTKNQFIRMVIVKQSTLQ